MHETEVAVLCSQENMSSYVSDVTGEVFSRIASTGTPFMLDAGCLKERRYFRRGTFPRGTEESGLEDNFQIAGLVPQDWSSRVAETQRLQIGNTTVSQQPIGHLKVARPRSSHLFWDCLSHEETGACVDFLLAQVLHGDVADTLPVEDIKIISEYVSDEVLREMEEWGIAKQMEEALEIIQQTYHTCDKIELSVSTDPEIPERKRLRITLTVSGEPQHVLEDELQFKEHVYSDADLREAYEFITVTYKWKD